jgi:ribosomal protein S12 methylthiotransferase accessory factor
VLKRHKLDPITFDCTPSGLNQLRLMKVFLPELTQAFLQSVPMLGHPRFHRGAELTGIRAHEEQALVDDPLPYP